MKEKCLKNCVQAVNVSPQLQQDRNILNLIAPPSVTTPPHTLSPITQPHILSNHHASLRSRLLHRPHASASRHAPSSNLAVPHAQSRTSFERNNNVLLVAPSRPRARGVHARYRASRSALWLDAQSPPVYFLSAYVPRTHEPGDFTHFTIASRIVVVTLEIDGVHREVCGGRWGMGCRYVRKAGMAG
jgi:hypothetical protein